MRTVKKILKGIEKDRAKEGGEEKKIFYFPNTSHVCFCPALLEETKHHNLD